MASAVPPTHGYPKLACEMGSMPEIAILRRFASLNVQNLLYFQAELVILEKDLREIELENSRLQCEGRPSMPETGYAQDWYWLGHDDNDPHNRQWQTILRIRQRLKEYNDAVLQQVTMAALPEPNKTDLEYLQGCFLKSNMGNREISLMGDDKGVWDPRSPDEQNQPSDLFVLRPRPERDPFSTAMIERFLPWLYRLIFRRRYQEDMEKARITIEDNRLLWVTGMITTIVASLLPISSIALLYCVKTMKARLALLALFTVAFAVALSCFTTARRTDVFAVTAAFAAVQVVFIGTNTTN